MKNISQLVYSSQIINEIAKNEAEVNRLVEERGVGASQYRDIIDDIVAECQDYIRSNPKNAKDFDGWEFDISKKLTSRFPIFNNLDIEIKIEDHGDKPLEEFGSGGTMASDDLSRDVKNGRFVTRQYIRIVGISHGRELYSQTVFNTLYHELNHKIDDLYRAINGNYEKRPSMQRDFYKLVKSVTFSNDKDVNDAIHFTVYRAFSTSELNALASGVYGDLKGINSERKNWQIDIKKTQAYLIYQYFVAYYKILSSTDINVFAKLKDLFDGSVAQGYKKDISVEEFREWFLNTLMDRMKTLYNNIGRVASLWYNDKENPSNEEKVGTFMWEEEVSRKDLKEFLKRYNEIVNY